MTQNNTYEAACTRRENDFWMAIYTATLSEWFRRTSIFTIGDLKAVTDHCDHVTKNAKELGRFL